eukprot:CAMPEP_0175078398 /NCGR_PEP_ID=MMETSP0052_2-20121109/24085_1 /TAXON_ID=51329 ORGANISM="Polytomella parva, Strain SAG 63-3" /NCGR_SAMPLE_ID=MMETSP0052_2 /ASSEMBLY_ACC=CAM_ASM_000194 /LENGTH=95 /DNA_ID=CAMNT_0016348293 /DNA_START=118 /DNA_END=405 /DNA_ORIENTATION=-
MSTAALEQRAKEAEARLTALEAKIGGPTAGIASVAELKIIKDTLIASSSHILGLEKELSESKAAQKALAEENEKLKYRIIHLLRAVEEADNKLKQ